jgi:hypothetical protein
MNRHLLRPLMQPPSFHQTAAVGCGDSMALVRFRLLAQTIAAPLARRRSQGSKTGGGFACHRPERDLPEFDVLPGGGVTTSVV